MKTPATPSFPLITLLATVLASGAASRADTTLVYGEVVPSGKIPEKEKVVSAQRIYLRDTALALETHGESRVVIFDRNTGTVRMVDHDRKIFLDLDDAMVAQIAERLTATQRKVLEGFEAKAADMPKKDRQRLREILDDLHAATAHQLTKVPTPSYQAVEKTERVGKFETGIVDVSRNNLLWARYYLVDHEELGMTEGEYETLVEFQKLMRRFSEQTPGALRKNFGDLEMLAQSGKVPVQVKRIHPDEGIHRLLNHFNGEIKSGWFTVPEDYQAVTLRPDPIRPGDGA